MKSVRIKPTEETQRVIREAGGSELKDGILAADLLKRPEMNYSHIKTLVPSEIELDPDVEEQVEIQVKYEGYIEKSLQQVDKMKKMENKRIPENIDYSAISGLASEARQKLIEVQTSFSCTGIPHFRRESCRHLYFNGLYRAGENRQSIR